MTDRVTISGADEVASTMRKAARDVGDLTEAHHEAAGIIAPVARAMAPRLTGALAGATVPAWTKTTAGVSNALPYFGPIHYGWPARNIAPHPFVDEAVDATRGGWVRAYERAIAHACAEVKGA